MATTSWYVRRSSFLALLLVACSQPMEQAPVAWETNLRVVVLSKTGAPIPDAEVIVRVVSMDVSAAVLDSASGLTDASGSYTFSRRNVLGGRYPTVISVSPPEATGLPTTTVDDSTEWEPIPARARTITLYLQH